jgi:ABC-type nickel/cobalt efflux system permease component RcnA
MRRLHIVPALAAGVAVLMAHPMGNFSVSHYTLLDAGPKSVAVTYVLDLAEIPTFELLREWKLDAKSARENLQAKAVEQAGVWIQNLSFKAGSTKLTPRLLGTELTIADGAGGLPVARITSKIELPAAGGKLEFEDRNFPERAGWKEIIIRATPGAKLIQASHGEQDRSKALSDYPADPAVAPPQDLRGALEWKPDHAETKQVPVIKPIDQPIPPPIPVSAPANSPQGAAAGTVVKDDFLSRLIGRKELPFSMILLGLAVAFGFGAMHALSPGHGKTIVAAYLVGSRGTPKHAALLGAMTTFTHTASVFALGFATLFLSQYIVPEKIYPVLGATSGLSIVLVGTTLFWKRLRRLKGSGHHHHHHHHDHEHHHHDHDHDHAHHHHHHHGPGGHKHYIEGDVSLGSLFALGASGGLVPCPSALVLLLSSIALGRLGLGLILLVAFSLGLAAVLMGIGMLVLYAKHLLPDNERAARHPAMKLLPVLSAAVITLVGCVMTAVSLGWVQPSRWIS